MKTIDFSYFIERYNTGEMSAIEQRWFQKELDSNKKLVEEVYLRKCTDEVLSNKDIISLRNKLSGIEKRRENISTVEDPKKQTYVKYAALITILIMIGSFTTLISRKNLSSEELINRYYKAYEPPTTQRSGQSESNADFILALEFYNCHDYEKAVIFFSKVLDNDPADMQTVLLNGVANFEGNRFPEAKQSFTQVINDNNNLFIETAKWYLALCYLKTDERDKAVQKLKVIVNEGGIYTKDAKKMIRKLK